MSLESLSKIKDPSSIPTIIRTLDHPIPKISTGAQEALDVFRNMVILEPLIEALKNDVLVKYIEHRLRKFGKNEENNKKMEGKYEFPLWVDKLFHEILDPNMDFDN